MEWISRVDLYGLGCGLGIACRRQPAAARDSAPIDSVQFSLLQSASSAAGVVWPVGQYIVAIACRTSCRAIFYSEEQKVYTYIYIYIFIYSAVQQHIAKLQHPHQKHQPYSSHRNPRGIASRLTVAFHHLRHLASPNLCVWFFRVVFLIK